MSKFIIIGHESSFFLDVERILQQHGMNVPNKSRQEQLTPVEISQILRKISIQTNKSDKLQNSLAVAPIIVKGKKRKKKQVGYGKNPSLMGNQTTQKSLSSINPIWNGLFLDLMLSNLDQELWGWSDSNALDVLKYWAEADPDVKFIFIYDHPSNIFLHSSLEQALSFNPDVINEKLNQWLKYNQELLSLFRQYNSRSVLVCGEQVIKEVNNSLEMVANTLSTPLFLEDQGAILDLEVHRNDKKRDSLLEELIVSRILQGYTEVAELYAELQNNATLSNLGLSSLVEENNSALYAWKELIEQKTELQKQQSTISHSQNKIEQLTISEHELSSKLEKIQLDLTSQKESSEIQKQKLLKELETIEKANKGFVEELKVEKDKIITIEKDKAKIEIDLKNNILLQEELTVDNKALLDQVHVLQQELERYFSENQKLKEKPALLGAVDRFKNQLDYRLGEKMIENSGSVSGWIKMPFLLSRIQREFLIYQKYSKQNHDLPNLEEYDDFSKLEKIKGHLSYQLGRLYLENNLLNFLLKTPKVVKEFRKNKNK